jgi:F-type H+-transporting ATPase subunit c
MKMMKKMKMVFYALAGSTVATLGSASTALASPEGGSGQEGLIAIAAGIAIAGAAAGAGIGQGRAVGQAMESIGRNPNAADRIQTPMIIGIAFMEALAIYALVIAFFLQGKIPG